MFQFRPYASLVFAMNKLPKIKDNSHGFYRRLIILPFNQRFEGKDADRMLKEKLLEEMDAIFNWALGGLDRLYENDGFTEPKKTMEMLAEYKKENNPILSFVEDCCDLSPDLNTSSEKLYNSYRSYVKEYGYEKLSRVQFFKEIYSEFPTLKKVRTGPRNNRVTWRSVCGLRA